jgi:hypothetical protein
VALFGDRALGACHSARRGLRKPRIAHQGESSRDAVRVFPGLLARLRARSPMAARSTASRFCSGACTG